MTKFTPVELKETSDASRGHQSLWEVKKEILLALAVLASLYVAVVLFANTIANYVPDSWERRIAMDPKMFAMQSTKKKSEHKRFGASEKIFAKLLRSSNRRELNYKLVNVSSPAPNAFALPGGTIGITSGLLDMVKSEIGIAMVLGHELGHVYHRHVLKRMSQGILLSMLMMSVGGNSDYFATGVQFATLSHSRQQELDADVFGLRLVKHVYGHTRGAAEFFEKVKNSKYGGPQSKWGYLLATHPYPEDRIRQIKSLEAKWGSR